MEAVVLAGGFGTRLQALFPDVPKPMAPIRGRPFLEILLMTLARNGFSRVVLSLGYRAELIKSHFGNRFEQMSLIYEIESVPLGTGGAIRAALQHCLSDPVFVFNGDTYLDLEVAQVQAVWRRSQIPIIVAREVADTARFGRLQTDGDRVTGFLEKGLGGRGLINAGCYVLPRDALDHFELGSHFSIETDYLERAVREQLIGLFITSSVFIDIGVPEDYQRAQILLAEQAR